MSLKKSQVPDFVSFCQVILISILFVLFMGPAKGQNLGNPRSSRPEHFAGNSDDHVVGAGIC